MRDWIASPGGWIEKSECTKHDQCPAGAFCKWSWTDSNEGWFYVGGVCRACSACECNGDAVDGNCPRDKCPMQPSQEVRYLQGAFEHTRVLDKGVACVYVLDVQGSFFRETQVDLCLVAIACCIDARRVRVCACVYPPQPPYAHAL